MKSEWKLMAAMSISCLAGITASARGIYPAKNDEIEALKNSTLIVVQLEESQKYEAKLAKTHKPTLVKAYQDAINTVNENIRAEAGVYIKMAKGIEYKTMSEIVAMSAEERKNYSYLVYDRATQYGPDGPSDFMFDFYADKDEELKGMLDDYLDYIQFDAADPKYHGEEDYRRLEIIVKGKKKTGDVLFMQSLDMIVPTKGSVALCFSGIVKQYNDALAGEKKMSKDEEKAQVRDRVAKARTKILWVCKDNLERNITAAKIEKVFKYKFRIVTRGAFDSAIINNDTTCCLLVVYPADKVQGGFRPVVSYQHLIVDAETDDVLLTVVPQATGGGMVPSYQKINDKHFTDIVKTEDDVTK